MLKEKAYPVCTVLELLGRLALSSQQNFCCVKGGMHVYQKLQSEKQGYLIQHCVWLSKVGKYSRRVFKYVWQ